MFTLTTMEQALVGDSLWWYVFVLAWFGAAAHLGLTRKDNEIVDD